MNFEIVDKEEIPEEVMGDRDKHLELKNALKKLPVGKALKIKPDGPHTSFRANISNWAAQMDCKFATRYDRQNKTMYVWKLELSANGNGQ